MDAAELGDRIVAVFDEDFFVELFRTRQPHGGVDGGVARDVELPYELVEEQPAQTLRRAGIAREERPFDDLRQVDQGKYRLVEVRDVTPEHGFLVGREPLFGVREHARVTIERG